MALLSLSDFERQVRDNRIDLPAVIAFTGNDNFIRTHALETLRKFLDQKSFSVNRFDDIEGDPQNLIRELRTASLFSDKTAIIVRSSRRGRRAEIVSRFKDQLLDYFDSPSRSNLLIIDGETFNGSMSVPKRIKKEFLIVECPSFKPWQRAEIERFIEERSRNHGLSSAPGVAAQLHDACSANLGLVERELEKLSLVVKDRPLTSDDLAMHLKYHGDADVFALCDAIIEGKRDQALALSTKVVRSSDPGPILQFLGLLESQLRKLSKLAYLLRTSDSPTTALGRAGYNPRSPRNATLTKIAKRLTRKVIRTRYRALLDTDFKLKTGAPDSQALITSLIVELTSENTPSDNYIRA